MGKRGTAPALVVSGAGYWVAPPPVTRERTAEVFGAAVADDVWCDIEKAFRDHQALQVHASAALTAADYRKSRVGAERAIAAALAAVMKHAFAHTTRDMEKMARHSPGAMAGTLDHDISGHLVAAAEHLNTALHAIRAAKPVPMKIPTAHDAKTLLVRRLWAILRTASIPVGLTSRGDNTQPIRSAEDLTPFERLVKEAGVHPANSDDALAAWVAEAIGRLRRAQKT